MTRFQAYALAHPLARAAGSSAAEYRLIQIPWSIILTVNK
jgi:hypothetical protein